MSSKEQRENILENMPSRLSDEEITALVKSYPDIKLDEGNQHFVIESKNEQGETIKSTFIPTWKKIPQKEGAAIAIEDELKRHFSFEEKGKN